METCRSITFTPDPKVLGDKALKDFVCDIFWGPDYRLDAVEDLAKHIAHPDGSDIFFSWDHAGTDVAVFRIPDFQPEVHQFWAQIIIPELTKNRVTFYIHYGNKEVAESLARPKEVGKLAHWAFFTAKGELGANAC